MKIKTENLSKSFIIDNKKINVINNMNFESADNSITIILGKSGCGKTTLVNALLNELSQICPHDRVISIEDTKELKIQV